MSRRPSGRFVSLLGSARFALSLMIVLGVLSFLATLVPQAARPLAERTAWAIAHPLAARLSGAFGFERAYTSWVFLVPAALLFASTCVCSWRRTTVARKRARALREARSSGMGERRADFALGVAGGPDAALDAAAVALASVGLRPSREGDRLLVATRPWASYASPAFHWTLALLMLAIALGQLTRAEGLAGVPVGSSIPLQGDSFRVLNEGPLHRWSMSGATIGVPKFAPTYVYHGIDRGPTPTVVVKTSDGALRAQQRVYPNAALQTGFLTVHSSDYGLASTFSLLDPAGAPVSKITELVDFSEEASSGTTPLDLSLASATKPEAYLVEVVVPLDRQDGHPVRGLPREPSALLRVTDTSTGATVAEKRLVRGESVTLPEGSAFRFDDLVYYARLSVVDDASIPFIYALMALSLVALSVALLAPQRLVVVEYRADEEGTRVDVVARAWRNAGVTPTEVRQALETTLGAEKRESGS